MHVGPSYFDTSTPVSAQKLHYHALLQRGLSPAEARRWVSQEYKTQSVFQRYPLKPLFRMMGFFLLTVAVVVVLTLVAECTIAWFNAS